jgi:hypothetical protein
MDLFTGEIKHWPAGSDGSDLANSVSPTCASIARRTRPASRSHSGTEWTRAT